MKKQLWLTLFFLIVPFICKGQMTKLDGVVAVQNSKINTGQIIYVEGVEIKHDEAKSDVTDSNGYFSLQIVGVEPNTQTKIEVTPTGKFNDYIVVNKRDINDITLGRKERINIYICEKNEYFKRVDELYNINRTKNDEKFEREIKDLKFQLTKAREKEQYDKAKRITDSIDNIEKIKVNMVDFIRDISEKMAQINLDNSDSIMLNAFTKISQGDLDSALIYIPIELIREKYLHGEILSGTGQKMKDEAIQLVLMKARLSVLKSFDEACSNYEEAIKLAPFDFEIILEYMSYLKTYNKYNSAKRITLEAIERSIENEKQTGIIRAESLGKVHFQLGSLMSEEGDFNNSEEHLNKAAHYFQILSHNVNDTAYVQKKMEIYTMLGQNARRQKNWHKAEVYMQEALNCVSIQEHINYPDHIIFIYFQFGEIKRTQSNYKEASIYFEKALAIYKSLDKEDINPYQYALLLSLLSLTKVENFEYNAARDYINEAIDIVDNGDIESSSMKIKEDCAGCFMVAAQCFERLNEISKAKYFMDKGMQIYTDLADKYPQIYADTYFMNLFENIDSENKESEGKLIEVIGKYTSLAKDDYALFEQYRIILLFKLTTYYEKHNNNQKADKYLKEALSATELLLETNPIKYYITFSDIFYNLGYHYLENKNLPAANSYFEKGISYYKAYTELNPMGEIAGLGDYLSQIGDSYTSFHEYVIAEKYLKQGVEILAKLGSVDNISYATALTGSYYQIANNYHRIALSDSALVYINKALDVQSNLYKKDPLIFNSSYSKMLVSAAASYRMHGNIEIADSLIHKSLNILQTMDSAQIKDHNDALSLTFMELANNYKNMNNHKDAKYYYDQAYPIVKERYRERGYLNIQNYLILLNNMGELFNSMEEFDSAEHYLTEGLQVYDECDSTEQIECLHIYLLLKQTLGISYLKQNKRDEGKEILDEVITGYEELYQEDKRAAQSNIGYITGELGLVYLEVNEYDQAYELLNKSIKLKEALRQEYDNNRNKYELSVAYKDMGQFYQKVDNPEKCIEFMHKSQDLLSILIKEVPSQYLGYYIKNGNNLERVLLEADSINQYYEFNSRTKAEIEGVINNYPHLKYNIINWLMGQSNLFRSKLDNIDKAIEYFEKGMLIYNEIENKDEIGDILIISLYYYFGNHYCQGKDIAKAEIYYKGGIDYINQLDIEKQKEYVKEKYLLYNDLSIIYFSENINIDKGTGLKKEVIKYLESKGKRSIKDLESLAKSYLDLGYLSYKQKSNDNAEMLLTKAILLFDSNQDLSFSKDAAQANDYMGYINISSNPIKSEQYFRKAIDIFEYNYKIDSLQALIDFTPILNNIANSYYEIQNEAKFEEYIDYILTKSEPVLETSEYLAGLVKIVDDLKKMENVNLCEKYTDLLLSKVSAIDENTFMYKFISMYVNCTKSQILVQSNKPVGEYLLKAIKSYSTIDDNDLEINSLSLVGLIFQLVPMDKTINEEVLVEIDSLSNKYKDQVIRSFANEMEEQRVNSVQLLYPLADFYLHTLKDPVKAKELYIPIISEIDKLEKEKLPNDLFIILVNSCERLGAIYYSENDYGNTEIYLERALELLEDIPSEYDNSSFKTEIKNRMVGLYINTDRFDKALDLNKDVLSFLESASQKSAQLKIHYSWALANHADIHSHRAGFSTAMDYYTKAVDLHNEILADNPDEQKLISDLCGYFQQMYIISYKLSDYQSALVYVDKHLEYLTKHSDMTTQEYIDMKKCDKIFLLLVLNEIDSAVSTLKGISYPGVNIIRVRFYQSLLNLINDEKEEAINILNDLIHYIESDYDDSKDLYNMIVEQIQVLHRSNRHIHEKLFDDYFVILKNKIDELQLE
ncbi:MAG: tetratricopeptide repeat protein [Prevotella sp.]|nr:tetratricopeptide repeat protein [Prevotella sp.]